MTTLLQFETALQMKLGLDIAVNGEPGKAQVDAWINEGVINVLLDTHCYVVCSTAPLTAGTNDYTLDANILALLNMYVTSSGVGSALEAVSLDDLLTMRRGDSNTSPPTKYAFSGSNLLSVYPTPSGADTLTFYYVPRPANPLVANSDDPSNSALGGIPVEYQKLIEYYALAEGADYDDDQSSAQGERYRQGYGAELAQVKRAMRWKTGAHQPVALAGYPRRRGYGFQPSQIGV